jgi:hypothetical protein
MVPRNLKVVAVDVQLPIDLAREIFRESGNLAISEFPATLEFAESLAEVLNLEQEEDAGCTEPTLMVENRASISVPARRKK